MDAADLYALPPEDFTAARDAAAAQAKADGDRAAVTALKALRRPSVSAWLVNRLARDEPELLDSLLALGPELAEAQATGSGDALRELGAELRALVDAVTGRAVALAGRPVTTAVQVEVNGTLEAALSDPASAQAVRAGRLVRALSYAGFGGVDLEGAVAESTTTGVAGAARDQVPQPREGGKAAKGSGAGKAERRIAAAEALALAAAGELDDAVRRCERLSGEAERAAEAVTSARDETARAEAALRTAEKALRDAEVAAKEAGLAAAQARHAAAQAEERRRRTERLGEQAVERVREAQLAAERSRAALDELRRSPTRKP